MMTNYLAPIRVLVDRLKLKILDATTIDAFENMVIGGNIQTDMLPALFVGDVGGDIIKSGQSPNSVKKGYYFVMVMTENSPTGFVEAESLINQALQAVLYQTGNPVQPRWKPEGYLKPFELADNQPPTVYGGAYTARSLIFSIQQTLTP